jgi:sporulation-control protein spo0M
MGFLDKMKSAAGVGTADIEIDVRQRPSKRGDTLDAVIRVTPGERAFTLNYVRASLEYNGTWTINSADGMPIQIEGKARLWYGDIEASKGVKIEPGGHAAEFPIQAKIPADSPLSGSDVKYHLWVRADLEGMKDPESRTTFDIKE